MFGELKRECVKACGLGNTRYLSIAHERMAYDIRERHQSWENDWKPLPQPSELSSLIEIKQGLAGLTVAYLLCISENLWRVPRPEDSPVKEWNPANCQWSSITLS